MYINLTFVMVYIAKNINNSREYCFTRKAEAGYGLMCTENKLTEA